MPTFPADDHRNFNRDGQAFNVGETFAGIPFEKAVELADDLKGYVPPGISMAEFSLRWILDYDAVTVVIPGARNPEQVRGNVTPTALKPLGDRIHAGLASFYSQRVLEHIRGPY